MASKRGVKRRLHTNKVAFESPAIAQKVVNRYRRRDGDTFIEVFKCRFGNHYHIGHNKNNRARYVKAQRNMA